MRGNELSILLKSAFLNAATSFTWTCAPFLVSGGTWLCVLMHSQHNINYQWLCVIDHPFWNFCLSIVTVMYVSYLTPVILSLYNFFIHEQVQLHVHLHVHLRLNLPPLVFIPSFPAGIASNVCNICAREQGLDEPCRSSDSWQSVCGPLPVQYPQIPSHHAAPSREFPHSGKAIRESATVHVAQSIPIILQGTCTYSIWISTCTVCLLPFVRHLACIRIIISKWLKYNVLYYL